MKSPLQRMLVSTAIALVSLASAGQAIAASPHHAAATHHVAAARPKTRVAVAQPGQVIYKDLIRPNGKPRSDAVHQADVAACQQQTGNSPYHLDGAAMKKCMLGRGYQFVSQRGFGSGSGRTVAGSNDSGYTPPDTSAADAAAWAAQQSANDATAAAILMDSQQLSDMTASNAAAAAQNALAESMIEQDTMNQLNNQ